MHESFANIACMFYLVPRHFRHNTRCVRGAVASNRAHTKPEVRASDVHERVLRCFVVYGETLILYELFFSILYVAHTDGL